MKFSGEKSPATTRAREHLAALPFVIPTRPPVSQVRHRDTRDMLAPKAARQMPMAGFDEEFIDIVDYIYRITHRIWVERAIGKIKEYYDDPCIVNSPSGVTRTVEEVVSGTLATMHAFPDRESHFLNVAWCGDADAGFYTSHLGVSRMTNRGPTIYGPATKRPVLIRTAADCISRNNKIHTEWLIRDNGAMVRQMGFDRHAVAQQLAIRPVATPVQAAAPVQPAAKSATQERGTKSATNTSKSSAAQFIEQVMHDLWNRRRLDLLATYFAPDVVVHSGGGRVAVGLHHVSALIVSMLTSIPDAALRVDHVCWSEERDGVIVAARWVIEGTTRAGGLLGEVPSGHAVSMMGISHFRFSGGKIVEEWTLFDEIALLVQAYRKEKT